MPWQRELVIFPLPDKGGIWRYYLEHYFVTGNNAVFIFFCGLCHPEGCSRLRRNPAIPLCCREISLSFPNPTFWIPHFSPFCLLVFGCSGLEMTSVGGFLTFHPGTHMLTLWWVFLALPGTFRTPTWLVQSSHSPDSTFIILGSPGHGSGPGIQ